MAENWLVDDHPADDWLAAFPLGNGRIGAMVFGGTTAARIQLNDASAWSGAPDSEQVDPLDPEAAAATLATVRSALADGAYGDAQQAVLALQHRHSQSYLPYADLHVEIGLPHEAAGSVREYVRRLDLSTAVHTERFATDLGTITWTSWVGRDPSVLELSLQTTVPAGVDVGVSLTSPLQVLGASASDGEASLRLLLPSDVFPQHDGGEVSYADPDRSQRGAVGWRWEHDGEPAPDGTSATASLRAHGVHELRLVLSTQTTAPTLGAAPSGDDHAALEITRARLATALEGDPTERRHAHVAEHRALYDRVRLGVGDRRSKENGSSAAGGTGGSDDEPTDPSYPRLVVAGRHPDGVLAADPGLAVLLFNLGRYLLITSSRPGGPPANLQGIWNQELPAPWSSNYTININLQMNYWAAEAVGLVECLEPLFDLVDLLQVTGSRTAEALYGARGWAAHHNTDYWGYSQPVGHGRAQPKWAMWPMAGCWLVQHLWDHLQFAAPGDPAADRFLRDRAWPAIRGAAQFGLDWLQERPDGSLGTLPSTSPENAFLVDGTAIDVGISSTMDLVLLRETFRYVVALGERLGRSDDDVVTAAAAALGRVPGPSVGAGGLVREWQADHPQVEPHHRHMSHLYFVHPGVGELTDELAAAARASLDARGDDSTGWSLSWKTALRARLGQGDKVGDLLRLLFRDMSEDRGWQSGGLYPNFFAAHPPYQIDGNFGYVAGLVEALLQSHAGEIVLLPALPAVLADGEVSGLRARGGVEVSMRWRAGDLTAAELRSPVDQQVVVRSGERSWTLALAAGQPTTVPLGR
jgi:alpha-L-fucosidase 2